MAIETFEFIDDLNAANPTATDNVSEGDDHLRGLKTTLKNTFPNVTGAINATEAELNILDGVTATATELNILDGVTATTAELNILDGVTSTATEINILDGAVTNTVVNSKAVVYGSAGEVQATTVDLGNWTVTEAAGVLKFATGGVNKAKLDASGNLTVVGDITAYGTI